MARPVVLSIEDNCRRVFSVISGQMRVSEAAARTPGGVDRLDRSPPPHRVGARRLQERVAEIIAGLKEAEGFALACGAALIARGDVYRETCDLDVFGLTPDAPDRVVPAVERTLQDSGFVVQHVQMNPGFARLSVESGDDRTELDLGADARLFPMEPGRLAPCSPVRTRGRHGACIVRMGRKPRLRRPDGTQASVRSRPALRPRHREGPRRPVLPTYAA